MSRSLWPYSILGGIIGLSIVAGILIFIPIPTALPTASATANTTDYLSLSCSQLRGMINQSMNNPDVYYYGNQFGPEQLPTMTIALLQIYFGQGCGGTNK